MALVPPLLRLDGDQTISHDQWMVEPLGGGTLKNTMKPLPWMTKGHLILFSLFSPSCHAVEKAHTIYQTVTDPKLQSKVTEDSKTVSHHCLSL